VTIGSHQPRVVLSLVVFTALLSFFSACQPDISPSKPGRAVQAPAATARSDFDFYLLALSLHAAFCADGHERQSECHGAVRRPLVIHGLWPENLAPRTYPHDCPAPALQLDPALARELEEFMPGMDSGLHLHEWREHGACSGLDADAYFRHALELARTLDAALRARLTTLAGAETSAAELRATADRFQPGLGATFTLHCRTLRDAPPDERARPFLVELRQCVDNDGPDGAPGKLLDCASMNRRDQGCGASFRIAEQGR